MIIIHPGCEKVPTTEWWERALIKRLEMDVIEELGNSEALKSILR